MISIGLFYSVFLFYLLTKTDKCDIMKILTGEIMAKQKYLYKNKKNFYKNESNQQENDFNYFYSPKYAKIVGQKYGQSGEAIENAFNQYFEAMKYFGLTNLINKDLLRKRIDELEIYYLYRIDKDVCAYTDLGDSYIALRKSAKVGDYATLFHEFNHLITIRECENFEIFNHTNDKSVELDIEEKEGDSKLNFESGYSTFDPINSQDLYYGFDEGVTEFLALMQTSYLNKKSSIISAYPKATNYAHILYLIVGNALFDGYFNGGNFGALNKCFNNQIDMAFVADEISQLEETSVPSEFIKLDYQIQVDLMNLFSYKLSIDVVNNLDKFKCFYEMESAITKAYCIYAGAIFFDFKSNSLLNSNRQGIFEELTINYYELIQGLGEYINNNQNLNKNLKFDFEKWTPTEEELEGTCSLFEMINDANYAFISYTEKPINVLDYIDDKKIDVYNMAKATYLRKKNHIDDVAFMKNYNSHEGAIEKSC